MADEKVAGDKAAGERTKRLIAAQQRRKTSKTKPLNFVLWTLGAWWLLMVLADIVITCVPGGASCRVPQLIGGAKRLLSAIGSGSGQLSGSAAPPLTKYDWALLLLGLIAAVWVARAKVYPETDDTGEFTEDELDGTT